MSPQLHYDMDDALARLEVDEDVKVVVVSGDSDPKTPERLYRLGANAYFGKPYSPAKVRQRVEQLLDANTTSQFP